MFIGLDQVSIGGINSRRHAVVDLRPHKNRSNFDCQTAALSGLI